MLKAISLNTQTDYFSLSAQKINYLCHPQQIDCND